MKELIVSLLAHIDEAYPKGAFLYITPQLPPPTKPKKEASKPALPPFPKSLPGVTLHPLPPTKILIVHGEEKGEELALLQRLNEAFSKKRVSSQVASASAITSSLFKSPLVKLIVFTPQAAATLDPFATHAKTYVMEEPKKLLLNPKLRQPLFSALCAFL